jgi:hypothetical protein
MKKECCMALIFSSKGDFSGKLNVVFCPNAACRREPQPFGLLVDQLAFLYILPVKISSRFILKSKEKGSKGN